jgi:cobalt/nickel transport system permease protein
VSLFHFGSSAEHGHQHGTFVEGLDPRVKLVSTVALALWIGLLPRHAEGLLVFLAIAVVVIGALAQIPPITLVLRASAALPFLLVPALINLLVGSLDAAHVAGMAGRGYVAAMVATLLVSVTPFASLLAAASSLGVPDILVETTGLVYRYLTVLREQAKAMLTSARARGYGPKTPRRFRVAGAMIGTLMLASLDRAERVHRSMLARGYTGRFYAPKTRMAPRDWLLGTTVIGGVTTSLLWLY